MSDNPLSGGPSVVHWLERFIGQHGGVAGTVHRCTEADDLELLAAVNIPLKVQQIVLRVPRGKGMAGLALEQNQPISSCNIKDDNTGRVRPGAKAVDAQAAVALPVTDAQGKVRAVVGIAFREEREITESELAAIARTASTLPGA
jgi:L-methionine (R)-S-oxide reductase